MDEANAGVIARAPRLPVAPKRDQQFSLAVPVAAVEFLNVSVIPQDRKKSRGAFEFRFSSLDLILSCQQ
jgi:hypothetical protein